MKASFIFFRTKKKKRRAWDVHIVIRTKRTETHSPSSNECLLASHILSMWMSAIDADNQSSANIRWLHINVVFIKRILLKRWWWWWWRGNISCTSEISLWQDFLDKNNTKTIVSDEISCGCYHWCNWDRKNNDSKEKNKAISISSMKASMYTLVYSMEKQQFKVRSYFQSLYSSDTC